MTWTTVVAAAGCSGGGRVTADAPPRTIDAPGPGSDATPVDAPVPLPDADLGALACPSVGNGGISDPSLTCFAITPVLTGAGSAGENATVASYALFPTGTANGKLLLYFNGSGSSPSRSIAKPGKNFYVAATKLGYAVLAVSYPSDESLKTLCDHVDGCYFPSRQTIITGIYQTGAANDPSLTGITPDAGIAGRAALALRWLATNDGAHDWGGFLVAGTESSPPTAQIDWTKVVAAGHSQGGGHAAAIGKLFPIARVIQLSSTCDDDEDYTVPASWLDGAAGTWATDPTLFWGLGSMTGLGADGKPDSGDQTCPTHAASWTAEGMVVAHRNDAAATCGATGSDNTHGVTIGCADNFDNWTMMLSE